MKKGITLALEVYLEGEQDPAADFAALTTTTVRDQLQAAFGSHPQGLTLQVKKVEEKDDSDDDSGLVLAPPAATPAPPAVSSSPGGPPAAGARPAWLSRIFPRGGSKGGGTPNHPDGQSKPPDSPYK